MSRSQSVNSERRSRESTSNVAIVTVALFELGGGTDSKDTEDIAVKSSEIAPGRFAWRKYKDQINLDAVRKRLWDAKKKWNFITGSETDGWMLTEDGLRFARSTIPTINQGNLFRMPLNEKEKRWRKRERVRLQACDAYLKFMRGEVASITRNEAEYVFRIDDYVTGDMRSKRIYRLLNAFSEDESITSFLQYVAKLAGSHVRQRQPNSRSIALWARRSIRCGAGSRLRLTASEKSSDSCSQTVEPECRRLTFPNDEDLPPVAPQATDCFLVAHCVTANFRDPVRPPGRRYSAPAA